MYPGKYKTCLTSVKSFRNLFRKSTPPSAAFRWHFVGLFHNVDLAKRINYNGGP